MHGLRSLAAGGDPLYGSLRLLLLLIKAFICGSNFTHLVQKVNLIDSRIFPRALELSLYQEGRSHSEDPDHVFDL